MSSPKKIRRIRILMIASQILLTLFVIQWLLVRFDKEKDLLTKDLQRELRASEDKMLDSLLLNKVVNPIIKGDKRSRMQMYVVTDSTLPNIITVGREGKDSLNTTREKVVVKLDKSAISSITVKRHNPDSIKIKPDLNVDSKGGEPLQDKLILRSLKVFTSKVADSTEGTKTFNFKFSTFIDSASIKSDFESKPLTNSFKLVWTSSDSNTKHKGIFISAGIDGSSLSVNVLGYSVYLIKKLLPQILFGIILLLLTGASFIISFISLKRQVELNTIRNEFVANISHELKTPVATVKVALEALQNFNVKNEPVQTEEYIRIAQAEMNRLDRLVQNVLASSIYDGNSNGFMQFEPLSLKEVVDEVVQSLQLRLNQANAQLMVDAKGSDFTVNADKLHVQGVLINLIDNSLKYVEGIPQIRIRFNIENDKILLSVSDNGLGIPSEYLTKVFDKFFRVPTQNRHNVKGYGLGLSYAAMVMKQHKGSISVENNNDVGCKFMLTFPKNV